jgi:hypothetical protein
MQCSHSRDRPLAREKKRHTLPFECCQAVRKILGIASMQLVPRASFMNQEDLECLGQPRLAQYDVEGWIHYIPDLV